MTDLNRQKRRLKIVQYNIQKEAALLQVVSDLLIHMITFVLPNHPGDLKEFCENIMHSRECVSYIKEHLKEFHQIYKYEKNILIDLKNKIKQLVDSEFDTHKVLRVFNMMIQKVPV